MMENSATRHLILGTAGHVNHGKSALVRALTGIDPDRLPEEKARGITIDLGFAHLKLPSPDATSPSLMIGIVDVPGHEDFVKNMVAGVGSIDAALFVVAADDGWMPQTEEHLQILTYLGVRLAVIALSKIDLAEDDRTAIAEVRSHLRDTSLADAPVIPVSTVTGRGIDDLKSAIANMLTTLAPARDYGKPRLAIDRAFTLKGIGTVVTGTLIGGKISCCDRAILSPSGAQSRIRSIQSHGREVQSALPGSRVALNLPDLRVAEAKTPIAAETVRRGDVITTALLRPSRRIGVLLWQCDRAGARPTPPLKTGSLLTLHHATSAVRARLKLIDTDVLNPDEQRVAILKTESPLLTFAGDRFVLRDVSARQTLAGGIIFDPLSRPMNHRRPDYRAALIALADNPRDESLHLRLALARDHVIRRDEGLAQSGFSSEQVDRAIKQATSSEFAVASDPFIVDRGMWRWSQKHVQSRVAAYHQSHPESAGLPRSDLTASLAAALRAKVSKRFRAELADRIVSELCLESLVCTNGLVRQRSHRPSLPPRLQAAGEVLRTKLATDPLNPPSRPQLCPTDAANQALRFLIASGVAIDLAPDVVISAEAYEHATRLVRTHLTTHGAATVSQLKALLESSRRVMVPLLERLDRDGVTRREGDLRRLRQPPEKPC